MTNVHYYIPESPPSLLVIRRVNQEVLQYYTSSPAGKFIFQCRYGKRARGSGGSGIEMDISIYHSTKKTPKVYFEVHDKYPFQPASMWICSSYDHEPKYIFYTAYLESTTKLIEKMKMVMEISHICRSAEAYDTWKYLLFHTSCLCCASKMTYKNWRPTYHLVDLAKEFYALHAMKRKTVNLFFVHRVCKCKKLAAFVENKISAYF